MKSRPMPAALGYGGSVLRASPCLKHGRKEGKEKEPVADNLSATGPKQAVIIAHWQRPRDILFSASELRKSSVPCTASRNPTVLGSQNSAVRSPSQQPWAKEKSHVSTYFTPIYFFPHAIISQNHVVFKQFITLVTVLPRSPDDLRFSGRKAVAEIRQHRHYVRRVVVLVFPGHGE